MPGKEDEEMAMDMLEVQELHLTPAESLKEAVKEMQAKREGKLPRRSARDMLKEIRKDMENGNL